MNTNIHLEYYRIFYYVVREGSITAAANALCITQPAISQSIKQLENGIGTKLFLRAQKGVKLTPEGEALFEYVKSGYETILEGEAVLERMLGLEEGGIRIGASDMTLKYFLLPYLEKFHEKHPGIKVNVSNGPTPETLKNLSEDKIDFCVVSGPLQDMGDLSVKKVCEIRDIFVAGSSFRHLEGKKLSPEEFSELPLICLEKGTSTRKYIDDFFSSRDILLLPEFELATSDMIVQFALRNLGIGSVVRNFAEEALADGSLFELQLDTPIPPRAFYLVSNDKAARSTAANLLLESLKQA